MPNLTAQLLQRYDVPTPRYTSYPTALAFEPMTEFPEHDTSGPVSLYFHMVFCRSLCWYCACTKEITRTQSRSGRYLDRLLGELELRADTLAGRPIVSMHLGGGTPTFFTAVELDALARFVGDRFELADDAELSIEIDPRELADAQVEVLAEAGFTRASLGVQDHDPRVQAAIHRHQPFEMTADAVARLRAAGIDAINVDLVYGLPHQTPERFRRTCEEVASLEPNRLAVYSYAHVPWIAPAQKLVTRSAELPDAEAKIAMFLEATDVFQSQGYRHIGMDHFALADDTLTRALDSGTMQRNFMGYTTHRGVDICGIGVSAISQTGDAYIQNARELTEWEAAIDAGQIPCTRGIQLTREDQLRREIVMKIMCSNEVDIDAIATRYDVDDPAIFFAKELEALGPLVEDGLVRRRDMRLEVTQLGRFLVRNIAATFDTSRREHQGYSRAV